MEKARIIIITGPTAAGKSALSMELAGALDAEIINADSMQVYEFMDIGTAKPTAEERKAVAHHLIDIVRPDQDYTAARYRADAAEKITEVRSRGKNAMVVGGTGLYIKALTMGLFEGPQADAGLRKELLRQADEYGRQYLHDRLKEVDPQAAASMHPNNIRRVVRALEVYLISKRPISDFQKEHAFSEEPFETLRIGLAKDRDELYASIGARVEKMMEEGLLEETRGLIERGYSTDLKPMRSLGYKEMSAHIAGELPMDEAVELVKKNTRRFAKRQMTWFKKDPGLRWFYPGQKKGIMELAKGFLN